MRQAVHMLGILFVLSAPVSGAAQSGAAPEGRIGLSGGMGVSYINPQDVVDFINGFGGSTERTPDFKAAVEFFGAVTVPLSSDWALKAEYTYMLGSYSTRFVLGNGEFTIETHMPTLIGQYVLIDEGVYNLRAGAGAGFYFGSLSQEYFGTYTYSGSGVGTVLDLEANTAFGENFYGHLGGNIRWVFIGRLTNGSGVSPSSQFEPTLHFFGVGARLGFTYYF